MQEIYIGPISPPLDRRKPYPACTGTPGNTLALDPVVCADPSQALQQASQPSFCPRQSWADWNSWLPVLKMGQPPAAGLRGRQSPVGHFAGQVPAAQFLPDCHLCSHTMNCTGPLGTWLPLLAKLWLKVLALAVRLRSHYHREA